jgi:hypothetical protein
MLRVEALRNSLGIDIILIEAVSRHLNYELGFFGAHELRESIRVHGDAVKRL